jgi:hypothetical protein
MSDELDGSSLSCSYAYSAGWLGRRLAKVSIMTIEQILTHYV